MATGQEISLINIKLARRDFQYRESLIEWRKSLGLSQRKLAKLLGKPKRHVIRLEKYGYDPRHSELRAYEAELVAYSGVSIKDYLEQ